MTHWQQYDLTERIQLLDIAAAKKGLPRLAIEKDWWVTMVLKALSTTQYADLLSFKGGTSLSKGWGLIERFSEDIDIAIKRDSRFKISSLSKNQLKELRKKARHYIVRELPNELTQSLKNIGVYDFTVEPYLYKIIDGKKVELRADIHPSVIYVNFKSIVPESSIYLQPNIKIEISCLSMDEPVEEKHIQSFISEATPDAENVSTNFKTVVPTRTFLEKIFLLHEEFQRQNPRSYRMSRHLYDLECLMDSVFGVEALSDKTLYNEIVKHRSIFNKIDNVDYETHSPKTINFIPPQSLIEKWEQDYNEMLKDFLYYKENRMQFDDLIARMAELTMRVKNME